MTTAVVPATDRRGWWAAAGLVLLSLVPVLAGGMRVAQLIGGTVPAEGARFVEAPVPVLAHVVGATVYCLVGAFQFVPRLRRHRWHRTAGRVLIGCGLAAALSGVWMAAFSDLPASDGPLLAVFRIAFGTAMAACLVLGLLAVRRRGFAAHDAWMTRAYAIGVAAGTQAVFLTVWAIAAGEVDVTARALLHAAAWGVNLAIAEVIVRRRRSVGRSGSGW